MGQYNNKGLYSGYDKNNRERQAEDYYATPPEEVTNILRTMGLCFKNDDLILDPCCGGGHLLEGCLEYDVEPYYVGTDIKDRTNALIKNHNKEGLVSYFFGEKEDFLSERYDDGFLVGADYIITNPPYSLLIPFIQHSLKLASKGVLMLGRIQLLEGEKRYEEILKDNPPSDVYVYVDRIACYKNGDFSKKEQSAQCYAWFYWDKEKEYKETKLHWIRRSDKNESRKNDK